MNEFNNRVAAQRQIIKLVNRKPWEKEDLFGLSRKAIERWVTVNRLEMDSRIVQLVGASAAKLFFLANKSQEQITDEYKAITDEIVDIYVLIEGELTRPLLTA